MIFLSQHKNGGVICRKGNEARWVNETSTIYGLAREAVEAGCRLETLIDQKGLGEEVNLVELCHERLLDCPVRHPDLAHTYMTGTGLTHLGSASTRNGMHANSDEVTDSMKMFQMGVERGKPVSGEEGVQPEWFYKGNGAAIVAPEEPLMSPAFALDGGEEPEIAGFYLVGKQGEVHRIGYALANEFSDHVTEKQNYLYLAHSKLRPASFGPELLIGELPSHIEGMSSIIRNGQVIWEQGFLSGEDNMSHSFRNLEHHHFKYGIFRQPGDLHIHMFGTATLSFADNVQTRVGDVFEIASSTFGLSLRNELALGAEPNTEVSPL